MPSFKDSLENTEYEDTTIPVSENADDVDDDEDEEYEYEPSVSDAPIDQLLREVGNTSYNLIGLAPVSTTFRLLPSEVKDILTIEIIRALDDPKLEGNHITLKGICTQNDYDYKISTEVMPPSNDNQRPWIRGHLFIPKASKHVSDRDEIGKTAYTSGRSVTKFSESLRRFLLRFGVTEDNRKIEKKTINGALKKSSNDKYVLVYFNIFEIFTVVFDSRGEVYKKAIGAKRTTASNMSLSVTTFTKRDKKYRDDGKIPYEVLEITKSVIKQSAMPTPKYAPNLVNIH